MLVVVDAQNGFVNDASRHVIPVIADIVDRWQDADQDVVFTRYFNFAGSPYERLFGWCQLQGPPSTEIVEDLAAQAHRATAVIDKRIYSLFTPEGRALVRRHRWTDLYICGIATESCVLKTAADAFELGDLTPWIIEDASASHAGQAAHDAGLLVARRFIGPSQVIREHRSTSPLATPICLALAPGSSAIGGLANDLRSSTPTVAARKNVVAPDPTRCKRQRPGSIVCLVTPLMPDQKERGRCKGSGSSRDRLWPRIARAARCLRAESITCRMETPSL